MAYMSRYGMVYIARDGLTQLSSHDNPAQSYGVFLALKNWVWCDAVRQKGAERMEQGVGCTGGRKLGRWPAARLAPGCCTVPCGCVGIERMVRRRVIVIAGTRA